MRSTAQSLLLSRSYDDTAADTVCGEFTLYAKGRLAAVSGPLGKTFFRYDQHGNVIREALVKANTTTCSPDRVIATVRSLTPAGRTYEVFSKDRAVRYIYTGGDDGKDRVTEVWLRVQSGSESIWRQIIKNVEWSSHGELLGYLVDLDDSSYWPHVSYTHGTDGRLAMARVDEWYSQEYDYEATWHIPPAGEQISWVGTTYFGQTFWTHYSYDQASRLVYSEPVSFLGPEVGVAASYEYDARGNMATVKYGGSVSNARNLKKDNESAPDEVTTDRVNSGNAPQLLSAQYQYDENGRTTQIRWPDDSSEVINSTELGYGSNAIGDSAVRAVQAGGFTFEYVFDQSQRRREKIYPYGDSTVYTYMLDNPTQMLLDQDQTEDGLYDDFYVWLGGRSVAVLRGKLNKDSVRQSDDSGECTRPNFYNSSEVSFTPCGLRYIVSDYSPKPVLMFDTHANVTGVGEYSAYGELNTRPLYVSTKSPYPVTEGSTKLVKWNMPNLGLTQLVRFNFDSFDTEEKADFVKLRDGSDKLLTQWSGYHKGHFTSNWANALGAEDFVLSFEPDEKNCPPTSPGCGAASGQTLWNYTGVGVRSVQYQRFSKGIAPLFTPLRFPGQYYDAETGLHENWNRFYGPDDFRYHQLEPLLRSSSYLRSMARAGHSISTYSYALNNPLRYTDFSGLYIDVEPEVQAAYGEWKRRAWPGLREAIEIWERSPDFMIHLRAKPPNRAADMSSTCGGWNTPRTPQSEAFAYCSQAQHPSFSGSSSKDYDVILDFSRARWCEAAQGNWYPDDVVLHHELMGHVIPQLFWGYGDMDPEDYAISSENQYRARAWGLPAR